MTNVLVVGESWTIHSTHIKGFDSFTTSEYGEGAAGLLAALEAGGASAEQLAAHLVPNHMPQSAEELKKWDVVVLSDIGVNSLLLPGSVFSSGIAGPDRIGALQTWVAGGGALVMCGGYMSFAGIEGKAAYHGTGIEQILPVDISKTDDRVERPAGITPLLTDSRHDITVDLPAKWPTVLGYNRITPSVGSEVLVTVDDDAFVVVGEYFLGRTLVWAGDIGPHWAPQAFVESDTYRRFWAQAMKWLTA